MSCTSKTHFYLLFFFFLVFASTIQAGGITTYAISTADTRLASAGWSSRAQDPSTVFTNPAGMSRLCGNQLELGAQPIFFHVFFEPNSQTQVSGSKGHANKWIPGGSFFAVKPLTDSISVGAGSIGYFGADLHFNNHWVGRYYVQETLLMGFSFIPAISYKINNCWSVGAAGNIMYGVFKQRSAVNNILDRAPDGWFNLKDSRISGGGVFGVLYEMSPCTRFGVQYMTSVKLNFRDEPKFSNVGPRLNIILERLGIIGSTLKLDVRVPQSVMLSGYHDISSSWSIMADVGWQEWSRFQQTQIVLADITARTFQFTIKYKDSWHGALGTEWHYNDCWTFSSGIAYDSSVITTAQRTFNFPVGSQWLFGTGARWYKSENLFFDLSAALQWQGDLKTTQQRGFLATRVSGKFKNFYVAVLNFNLTKNF